MDNEQMNIKHVPLELPHDTFGAPFVTAGKQEFDRFDALCDMLLVKREQFLNQGMHIPLEKPAVSFRPSQFLARPLTSEETAVINEELTPGIARFCVDVQAKIARVPVVDCGERLVHLPVFFNDQHLNASFSTNPYPDVSQMWSGKPQEFWARQSFAERLVFMGRLVAECGVSLHFEEVFRPREVQAGMFRRRLLRTQREHRDWGFSEVLDESLSKTASTPRLASHMGGAAADIMLRNYSGQLLDVGHEYPDGGSLVFPRSPFVTAEQWHNRQLLQVAAGLSGLTLYVGEDWHVSFGDNTAAIDDADEPLPGYIAKFGPIKDFDRVSGEVTATFSKKELGKRFVNDEQATWLLSKE